MNTPENVYRNAFKKGKALSLACGLHLVKQSHFKEEHMTKSQLLKKIAYLESLNDQLSAEVIYVDHLMRLIGFSEGLMTVKATAQEILDKGLVDGQSEAEGETEDDSLRD